MSHAFIPFIVGRLEADFVLHVRVSKEEKDEYVESIIELLELQELSEALVLTLSVEGMTGVS